MGAAGKARAGRPGRSWLSAGWPGSSGEASLVSFSVLWGSSGRGEGDELAHTGCPGVGCPRDGGLLAAGPPWTLFELCAGFLSLL